MTIHPLTEDLDRKINRAYQHSTGINPTYIYLNSTLMKQLKQIEDIRLIKTSNFRYFYRGLEVIETSKESSIEIV